MPNEAVEELLRDVETEAAGLDDEILALGREISSLGRKLSELKEARSKLEVNLEFLRARAGKSVQPIRPTDESPSPSFAGMSKFEAAKALLHREGRPLRTAEVCDGLLDGGFETTSPRANFYTTLYQVLKTKAKDPDKNGIRKDGNDWVLTSWTTIEG